MAGSTPWVPIINLANSIIGVGVLAMPWCFNKCGVILATCLLFLSAFLTYTSCMLLLRAAKATKKTSYENLAYHVLGGTGKMAVELCIIGLLFCSCVSFFIIIGDLGPAIISKWFAIENTWTLRAMLQVFLAVSVVLPLGLKRSVESLAAVSGLSMVFYICFTADMFLNSLYDLSLGKWRHESTMWNTPGGFVCITITTIAFSCQTVLFTIYESMTDRTIKKMQEVVKSSVSLVTTLYLVVGLCGYVTYYKQGIKGDILLNFKPSLTSDIFQLCFTLSVALSFPLVIFPCRTSLYSMFCSQSTSHSVENPGGSGGSVYIPQGKFNTITLSIIILTLSLGIIVQNVETVLALTGATLGSFICFILPAIIYNKTQGVANKGTAKFILVIGISLTVIGLYHNLQSTPNDETPILEESFEIPQPGRFIEPIKKFENIDTQVKLVADEKKGDVHIEPPNPHPPVDIVPKEKNIEKDDHRNQDVAKARLDELIDLEHEDEDEKEKKGQKEAEKQDAEAEVIEQLKEKQVEQEKKIEAQAEEIEILKKQHEEEELERKEKERQERIEREERERKEQEEKQQKKHEEMVKEKKEKEDAAIIEKAKEVIEQAAVLQGGLGMPQAPVGDQGGALQGALGQPQVPIGNQIAGLQGGLGQPQVPVRGQGAALQGGLGMPQVPVGNQGGALQGGVGQPQLPLGDQAAALQGGLGQPQVLVGGQAAALQGGLGQPQVPVGGQGASLQGDLGQPQVPVRGQGAPLQGGVGQPQVPVGGQGSPLQGGVGQPQVPVGDQVAALQGGGLPQAPIGNQGPALQVGVGLPQLYVGDQGLPLQGVGQPQVPIGDLGAAVQEGVGLPQVQVRDQQQLGIGVPYARQDLQDNAAFGGQLQQQQNLVQMNQQAGVQPVQIAQGIPQDMQDFKQEVRAVQGMKQEQAPALGQGEIFAPKAGIAGLPGEQQILPGAAGGPLIDQGMQQGGIPGLGQGGQEIQPVQKEGLDAQPVDQRNPVEQNEQRDEKVNQRQDRAALKPGSHSVGDKMVDVNKKDKKIENEEGVIGGNLGKHNELIKQKKSDSKAGSVEKHHKSALADNLNAKDTDVDLQLDLVPHDDDTADSKQKQTGNANAQKDVDDIVKLNKQNLVKENDAEMQLVKAVKEDVVEKDAIEKHAGGQEGNKVEQKKKVEM
ncbi:putative sodium-coupled neutral amino acid transporter 10 [Anneissia japonica]|uniref:putative sodium-coupled neutral amino acid transporter 10 n=1 Tax=Anneissia japonica TaxID=1529436 RepID=UPI001425BA70|nr:putative sodium-coupled neutral amino acid transporter 10 [Anneissia japonica]